MAMAAAVSTSVVIKTKPFKTKTKTRRFKTKTWPLPTKLTQRLKDRDTNTIKVHHTKLISGDIINKLRSSGYGLHIGSLFVGCILYADDIVLLSPSCFGLQNFLTFVNSLHLTGTLNSILTRVS